MSTVRPSIAATPVISTMISMSVIPRRRGLRLAIGELLAG